MSLRDPFSQPSHHGGWVVLLASTRTNYLCGGHASTASVWGWTEKSGAPGQEALSQPHLLARKRQDIHVGKPRHRGSGPTRATQHYTQGPHESLKTTGVSLECFHRSYDNRALVISFNRPRHCRFSMQAAWILCRRHWARQGCELPRHLTVQPPGPAVSHTC